MAQPRCARGVVPGSRGRCRRPRRLVARAQHAREPARTGHPERLRLPELGSRLRDRRNPDLLQPRRLVCESDLDRPAQHDSRRADRHRSHNGRRRRAWRRPLLAQRVGARSVLRLRRDVPQRTAPPAVADVVSALRRCAAAPACGVERRGTRLPEQGRLGLPGTRVERGTPLGTARGGGQSRGRLGLATLGAAAVRAHRAGARPGVAAHARRGAVRRRRLVGGGSE